MFTSLYPNVQKKPKETNSKISGAICRLGTYLLTFYLYSCVLSLGEEFTWSVFPLYKLSYLRHFRSFPKTFFSQFICTFYLQMQKIMQHLLLP